MIGKITTGDNFKPLTFYLLKEEKNAVVIGGNLGSNKPAEIYKEFQLHANSRPRTKKPVKHYSIAFAPEDGELDNELKAKIAEEIVKKMGFTGICHYDNETEIIKNQFLVVGHHRVDPGHEREHKNDHMHIVINLVNFDAERINDGWDKRRLEKVLRELEVKYDLRKIQSSKDYAKDRSELIDLNQPPQNTETQKGIDTLETLKEVLEPILATNPSYEELVAECEYRGVTLEKLRNNKGFRYTVNRTGIELVQYTRRKKPEFSSNSKSEDKQSDRFYQVDLKKRQLNQEINSKITEAVNASIFDNPDYFVFQERLKQLGINASIYRTPGRKRAGRYKLKYRIGTGLEIRSRKDIGGTLHQLVKQGKITFDPNKHYQKEIPQNIVDQQSWTQATKPEGLKNQVLRNMLTEVAMKLEVEKPSNKEILKNISDKQEAKKDTEQPKTKIPKPQDLKIKKTTKLKKSKGYEL